MVDKTHKMLQILVEGQAAIRGDIKKLDNKLTNRINGVEEKLTERIDKLGMQIANLEDDSPTVEEFDTLEKRVIKVEQRLATV